MKKFERRVLAAVLATVLLVGFVLPAAAEETQETETQEASEILRYTQTIYIRSARELLEFAENCKLDTWSIGKRVILKKDIDLEGIDFAPIPTFAGRFDGQGHAIRGLTLDGSLTPVGLFGELQATGTVCDLTVSGNITPSGDAQYVGGIVGENHGTVANCTFTGSVSGSGNVGGIVGLNGLTGKIQNCQAEGTIQGSSMAGGITGCNLGLVEDSSNRASVNTVSIDPTVDASDINFDFLTDISKLTSLDTRSAAMDTGGIAGYSSGILTGCTNEATIGYPRIGYNVGGIAGRSCGYVSGCANQGEIYGRKDVGGILGQMEPFIAKNLSESSLAQLQQQLEELDDLVGTALEDGDGLSDTLTARLGAIASSVGSAADAAGNIQTFGSISSDVTGSGESGAGGSITITPAEGGIGGGIQIGDGSISGGIGGSLSGGVAGDGNGSASGSLNAQTQIEIDTNLEGLSSALSNMAGQMRILSGELSGASASLKADVEEIRTKINEITQLGFDLLLGDNEDVLIDSSDIDMDQITLGKAANCKNSGLVSGDINTGGIAGCMAMEYALDPEDDLTINTDKTIRRKYEVKAVIYQCENTGTIQAKRNYAGGIAGKMDVGLIAQCEAYGNISSENGNYVGGISGICGSTIRHCFAKCSLSGGKYIGGIVGSGVEETKAGTSSTVAACYAIVTIADHEQYIGAISGAYAGTFLENYFVSEDLAGINRMSYTGCAQPLSYRQLLEHFEKQEETDPEGSISEPVLDDTADGATAEKEGSAVAVSAMELPDEFKKFHLSFVADGETIYSDVFDYGASFADEVFPEIPQKKGYYAYWDRTELNDLRFDTTVTAVYEPYISVLSSLDIRNGDKPIFFAEGDFGEADTFAVTSVALTPGAFLANGIWDAIGKSLTDGKVNTEVVEQWRLQISGEDTAQHTIRYLPPDGDAQHMDVYAMVDGEWAELETEVVGSYVTFSTRKHDVAIAVVHSINTWWAWLVVVVLLLAVVMLIVCVVNRRKKRKADAVPDAAESASDGAETVQPEGNTKKRRRLTPLLILALLLGILGTSAFLLLPDLIAQKGACEAITACLEKDTLSMELQVDAKIGTNRFPITADIQRTSVNGEKVTSISQNEKILYYVGGTVFLENGNAYRISDSLPDYSDLLEQAVELYRYIDVEAVDNTYSITANGADAKALLELLIPSSASFIADTECVYVDLITEDGQLSKIQFRSSGYLKDDGASSYNVNAVLRILKQSNHVDIPEAVRNGMASGKDEGAEALSEDMFRLLSGWQNLNDSDFWSATATLSANCGALALQEDVKFYRWLVEDTTIYSVQENGHGLYMSSNSICDRNGNTVSASKASNVDVRKLMDVLYSLCMNVCADCDHSGGSDIYTLTLDSDGMGSLAHAIAPKTEKMNITFTSGSIRVVVEQEEIQCAEVSISGSVQVVLSKADASVTAALDFTKGGDVSLPDAVKTALAGGK